MLHPRCGDNPESPAYPRVDDHRQHGHRAERDPREGHRGEGAKHGIRLPGGRDVRPHETWNHRPYQGGHYQRLIIIRFFKGQNENGK